MAPPGSTHDHTCRANESPRLIPIFPGWAVDVLSNSPVSAVSGRSNFPENFANLCSHVAAAVTEGEQAAFELSNRCLPRFLDQ